MKQRVFRAARLTLLFPFVVLFGGLFWCIWFTGSPLVAFAISALIATILTFTRERTTIIWRQKLILEADSLIYFDGHTRHEFRFTDIKQMRLNRWVGNFRGGQNEGHSLVLIPQSDGKIEHWDLSDFPLRVVLQVVCDLARRADCPEVEIFQTEFQNLKAELFSATHGLGTLSLLALGDVDEESLSFYEKEFRNRERRYLFAPRR